MEQVNTHKNVLMYSTLFCPYCLRARRFLKKKGITYHEIRIDKFPHLRQEMIQKSKRHTVPQIFIAEQSIGGYDDMVALDRKGKFKKLLNLK